LTKKRESNWLAILTGIAVRIWRGFFYENVMIEKDNIKINVVYSELFEVRRKKYAQASEKKLGHIFVNQFKNGNVLRMSGCPF